MKKVVMLFPMMIVMACLAGIAFAAGDGEVAAEATVAVTQVDPVNFIQTILSKWYLIIMTVISMASVIVNITPTETDNKVLAAIDSMLNIMAGNFNVKGQIQKGEKK